MRKEAWIVYNNHVLGNVYGDHYPGKAARISPQMLINKIFKKDKAKTTKKAKKKKRAYAPHPTRSSSKRHLLEAPTRPGATLKRREARALPETTVLFVSLLNV